MNIIFIGQVLPDTVDNDYIGFSVAGDLMQKNIIFSLNRKENVNIFIISAYPIAPFPKEKKIVIKENRITIGENLQAISVKFTNIPIVKQVSQSRNILKAAKKIIRTNKVDFIMTFNLYPQFGTPSIALSNRYNIPLIAILADFPVEVNEKRSFFQNILFRPFQKITWNNIELAQNCILLNQNAKRYINQESNSLVISGGINLKEFENEEYMHINNKRIVYAGALTEYSGIMELIKAVALLDSHRIYLEIYGNGILKEDIKKAEQSLSNVKYMGVRPIEEMRQILKHSWVLVNPRSVEDPVSEVTFPSKLLEYIMCKRPVITTEFPGIPDDIKKITISCSKGSVDNLVEAIKSVEELNDGEIEILTSTAYHYVTTEMSWDKQAEKILNFINRIDLSLNGTQ